MASQAIYLTYCIILIRVFSYWIISSSYKIRLINLLLYSPPQYKHECHTPLSCPASVLLLLWVNPLLSELFLQSICLSFGSLMHSHCFRLQLNILLLAATAKIITCSDLKETGMCFLAPSWFLIIGPGLLRLFAARLCDLLVRNWWQWPFCFLERQAGAKSWRWFLFQPFTPRVLGNDDLRPSPN